MKRRIWILSAISLLLVMLPGLALVSQDVQAAAKAPTATPTATVVPFDPKIHWNLADIYPDQAAWEKDYQHLKTSYIPKYKQYQGQIENAVTLGEFLKIDQDARRLDEKLVLYANLNLEEKQADSSRADLARRAAALHQDLLSAAAFVRPELAGQPAVRLQNYIKNPDLKDAVMLFQAALDQKDHTLSSPEETLLAQSENLAAAPAAIAAQIRGNGLKFPVVHDPQGKTEPLSEDNFDGLLLSPERTFREQVFQAMYDTYAAQKYPLAAALDAQVQRDLFYAAARKYPSALDAALDSNQLSRPVYDSVTASVDKNAAVLGQYVTLRKEVFKLKTVQAYDLTAPLESGFQPKDISYVDAQAQFQNMFTPFGTYYLTDLQAASGSGWVDVYPTAGKMAGAGVQGSFDTHPYVLLNYDQSVASLLGAAHQMGAALAVDYSRGKQPYYSSAVPAINQQVAGDVNEIIVLRNLASHSKSDAEKLYYLDLTAQYFYTRYYRPVMVAEFEDLIHQRVEKGETLSVETLNQVWGDVLVRFLGPDFELTDEARLGWAYTPELYNNYAGFNSAAGAAAADFLVKSILANEAGASDKYQAFLQAGTSDTPAALLKSAGADMLTHLPADNMDQDFKDILSQMKTILVGMKKVKK